MAAPGRSPARLHHIGVGRTYAGTTITMIIDDLRIRVADATTGTLTAN